MITLFSLLVSLFAAALALAGKIQGAWIVLGIAAALLFIALQAMKWKKMESRPALSAAASAMLEKHMHYFLLRQASSDMGKAAIALHLAGLVVAAIGAFKGFYPGLLLGAAYFVLLALLSRDFDPRNFNQNQADLELLAEIDEALREPLISAGKPARQRSPQRRARSGTD